MPIAMHDNHPVLHFRKRLSLPSPCSAEEEEGEVARVVEDTIIDNMRKAGCNPLYTKPVLVPWYELYRLLWAVAPAYARFPHRIIREWGCTSCLFRRLPVHDVVVCTIAGKPTKCLEVGSMTVARRVYS